MISETRLLEKWRRLRPDQQQVVLDFVESLEDRSVNSQDQEIDMIEYWIQHPFQIEGFKPLTRDEIYDR